MSRIFIRTKNSFDRIQEYLVDEEGYAQLRSFYNSESYFENIEDYRIIDYEEIMYELDTETATKIELLTILEGTNCGHCDAPWLDDETFREITKISANYHFLERNLPKYLRQEKQYETKK